MASPATQFTIQALVSGLEQVEGLKSAVRSLQNTAQPAAQDINKLRDAAKSLGNAAEASTSDLRTSVTVLKSLKDQVALTSKEYRDLSNDLKTVENRFNAANTAAKQFRSSAGPLSGGTAGAAIMGRPVERLEPAPRLGFETNDPEYWRKRQETHPGGAAIFPQQLDYAATNKALSSMQSANDQMTAVANKGRQDRLLVQEKYNQLEIAQQDAAHKKQLLNQQRMDDIEGRFFEMRLNNAASIREKAEQRIAQRRQRLATAGQTVGAVAAAGVFGGPEGALGATIGAIGGPGGALVGGAIGAQVGMIRQSIGDTATYASEITKLNIALKGITKTSEEYADAQRAISSISNTLNVPVKEATAGFTKLSASVIGAGGNVNDAQIVFKGITTAIKATGGSATDVQSALLAMSQVFSKGKVSAEELQGQLGERLPGAVTAFAKATGRTLPQLSKDLEQGVVGLNDVMKFVIELEKTHAKTASDVAQSSEESGARMTVALDKLKLAIGETYQPIGSGFQESITNATNIAIGVMESHKKNTEDLGKTISKTFGEETTKNIGDWFQRFNLSVAASVLGLQPLLNAINAINNYMGTKKTGQQKMIEAGSPTMYSDAQGNVYDAVSGRLIMKPPTKFEPPKSGDDDAAKKEAKLKQQIELQRELNDIESQFNAYELPRLKGLQEIQLRLAALDKDANVEAKKNLQLKANELEYQLDAFKISKQANIELAKSKTIEDKRLQFVQRQGIDEKMQDEQKKLNLTRDTKRKAIEQGVTLELKKQTEELGKQNQERENTIKLLEQQFAQPQRQGLEEMQLRMRYRRDPRALEAELEDLQIRRKADAERAKFPTPDIKAFESIAKVEEEAIKGAESIRALKRSIDELNAADVGQGFKNGVESFLTSIGTMSENVSQLTQNAFQGLSDGIAELVTTGKMNFNDFANSIIKDMIRIATQQLILRPILQGISGLFGGGGGLSGGGYFDSITGLGKAGPNFGLAKGGVITQNGIQAFARGGIVDKPMLFPFAKGIGLMGEAGPEAIMPLRRGRDGNLGVAGGGGTTNVVVNVDAGNTSAQGDAPRGEQLGKALSAAVQAELIKQRRPGGLLA